jgi:hypothetical protein
MKKHFILIAAIAAVAYAGCTKSTTGSDTSQSAVMFVNASTTGSGITPLFGLNNNVAVTGADNLGPLSYTTYKDVKAGSSVCFAAAAPSGGAAVVGGTVNVGTNKHYSLFVYGRFDSSVARLVSDDLIIPQTGAAKVRIANFIQGSSAIAAHFNNVRIDTNVAYPEVDAFIQIPAGIGRLQLNDPANPTVTATLDNQEFVSGKLYTVMITNAVSALGGTGYTLTVINNY